MNRGDLLALLAAENQSVVQVKEHAPQLFAQLRALACNEARSRLAAAFTDAKEKLAHDVDALKLDDVPVTEIPRVVRTKLGSELGDDGEARLKKLETGGAFADPLAEGDTLVRDLPLVQDELDLAKVYFAGDLAQVAPSHIEKVVAQAPSLLSLDDDLLGSLVGSGDLSENEAAELGLAAALFMLCDEDPAVAKAVQSANAGAGAGSPPETLRALAALTPAGWGTLLTRAKAEIPAGTKAADYARAMSQRFAALYPTVAFLGRLPAIERKVIEDDIRTLAPLFGNGGAVLAKTFDELDWSGLDASGEQALRKAFTELSRICRAYPGLELEAAIEDTSQTPEARAELVVRRTDSMKALARQHPDKELLFLDYAPDQEDPPGLDFAKLGLTTDDQRRVVSTLKAYQRVHTLTDDVDAAHALLQGGLTGASQAGAMSLDDFKQATALDDAAASKHHANARAALGATTSMAATALDVVQGGFERLRVSNVGPEAEDMLRRFEGFADLFGSQAYCRCDECRSILGPAAYFVDLMWFVDENVRQRFFRGDKGKDPLNLKTRRPDLWHLPLTCDNTNTLTATLDIANEVLENYIALDLAAKSGTALALHPRGPVESLVYETTFAKSVSSFGLPFVLPLVRLTTYLEHFKRDRGDIARALGAARAQITRAELRLSIFEYHTITHPDADPENLARLYDHTFTISAKQPGSRGGGPTGPASELLTPVDVEQFLRAMDIGRADFADVVATRFVAAGAGAPRIVSGKQSKDSVQDDTERVHGLTYDALDRMHRFTRLVRRVGWTAGELDVVLHTLDATALDAATLDSIVDVERARERLHTSIEDTCPLFGKIPQMPVEQGGTSLFDRLFNVGIDPGSTAALPNAEYLFLHPALRAAGSQTKPDPALPRLLAGLRISDDDLLLLISKYLTQELGVTLGGSDEDSRRFALTAAHLSLLYRHARLAELLSLSISELFQLIEFIPRLASDVAAVRSLDDLTASLDFHAWWKKSGFSLDDTAVMLGRTPSNPDAYPSATGVAAEIIADTDGASPLEFADTIFAVALGSQGVTEDASRSVVQALVDANLVEATADGGYRVTAEFDPNVPLTVPAVAAFEADARAALAAYHPLFVVPSRLSAALEIAVDKISALIEVSGNSLLTPEIALALQQTVPTDGTQSLPPGAQSLVDLVSALVPLAVAFRSDAFDGDAIKFASGHRAAFGLAGLPRLDLVGIRSLSVYAAYAPIDTGPETAGDTTSTGVAPPVSAVNLHRALAHFDASTGFAPTVDDDLARIFGTTKRTMSSLRGHVRLDAPAAHAFEQIAQAAEVARRLGVGGQALADAVASTDSGQDLRERATAEYQALARAVDAVEAAFRAQYADDAARETAFEPFDNEIRAAKRDALTGYLVHVYHPRFRDLRAIYEYFLIDVELEGCARTSRLVSATNSVQLYFQRCLLDLEQDRRPASDPNHVHVQIAREAADEWTWRKEYRVWQAARKIFLYPESYLEPDLRDDKTPLFEDLEAALLQQQINQQSVLDAYTVYMDGFQEVGDLTIAGAYYHDDKDTLHLVGVTASDPPTYYYRAIENPFARKGKDEPVYHAWTKISVQIPVRRASPVMYENRLLVFWIEVRTQSVNEVSGGGSNFTGYRHKLTLKYTSLRLDGKWTPPQEIQLPKNMDDSDHMAGTVTDYFENFAIFHNVGPPRLKLVPHTTNPIDDYTLTGPNWDTPYPDATTTGLVVVLRNFRLVTDIGLFQRVALPRSDVAHAYRIHRPKPQRFLLSTKKIGASTGLYFGSPLRWYAGRTAFANLVLEEDRILQFDREYGSVNDLHLDAHLHAPKREIATLGEVTGLLAISGSIQDLLIQAHTDLLLVRRQRKGKRRYRATRLGTTLADRLARKLFAGGVSALLDPKSQEAFKEANPPLNPVRNLFDDTNTGTLDFTGPYGVYYREIFLHIPFLIATELNSQGNFSGARRWLDYLFDPSADGKGKDRVWRYFEFRNQTWPTLRKILKSKEQIETWQKDPFNPHAIARSRLSAYAKSVVMKYLDNLLDWGDRLFTEFTMESVNEATLLYTMVADILGDRPYEAADCGQSDESVTFAQILPALAKGSTFLLELESHAAGKSPSAKLQRVAETPRFMLDPHAIAEVRAAIPLTAETADDGVDAKDDPTDADPVDIARGRPSGGSALKHTASTGWSVDKQANGIGPGALSTIKDWPSADTIAPHAFGWSLVRQMGPVFCVPPNEDLLHYWDRVDDRLYKIHHCLDITGKRRDLALFAPELNPRLLARMKAAGLSLDDLTNATSGDLPPYRFVYLIERAKSFATTLQSFGSALLSALEKKDAEELARLRLVHEQNLLSLTIQIKQWEIDAAEDAIDAATQQKQAAEFRRDHYQQLLDTGLSGWEVTEEVSRFAATITREGVTPAQLLKQVVSLIPQLGSPWAMVYGGVQLGGAAEGFADSLLNQAEIMERMAQSAGLEASFDRRREEWQFQHDVADLEAQQLDKQLQAAQIRKEIATQSLTVHQKSIEQSEEVLAFYGSKFTGFGLYTWLGASLQRTYRQAYANALSLARLCQAAFEWERDPDPGIALGAGTWDGAHAGLLAGEKLLLELQTLERRFIETNYRTPEIEQSFALTQIDPAALISLQETGECTIDIPEVFFDLAYPGHYKRQIKCVRLTIPCVAGPYTNVGATLTLTASSVRNTPDAKKPLTSVPLKRTVSIATSKAQNDAGVFELSFHDERYMPFEGAGAISTWKLDLPKTFRPFDYDTISDVIVTINYIALADDALRQTVEANNAELEGAILKYLSTTGLTRVISLRQEFPLAYRQLVSNPPGTPVSFTLDAWHFPAFVTQQGRRMTNANARVAFRSSDPTFASSVQFVVDGEIATGFSSDATLGGLPAKELKGAFVRAVEGTHTIAITVTASAALVLDAIDDVLLCVAYRVAG